MISHWPWRSPASSALGFIELCLAIGHSLCLSCSGNSVARPTSGGARDLVHLLACWAWLGVLDEGEGMPFLSIVFFNFVNYFSICLLSLGHPGYGLLVRSGPVVCLSIETR